jgi:EAL domain-containing protein (putative c-di-GMP-specific phosphodiesterase class I)
VAVFVTAQETLPLLRQEGVRYAQGYAVGRPRPIEDSLRGEQRALPAAPS